LRAYHHLKLRKSGYAQVFATTGGKAAHLGGKGYHLEHAIPIAYMMWALFNNVTVKFRAACEQVQKIIDDTMYVAYFTHAEHAELNRLYASSMPPGYEYPWDDPCIRYQEAKVEIPR
jgi:hypothetical protein